jgi:hypothetical protein
LSPARAVAAALLFIAACVLPFPLCAQSPVPAPSAEPVKPAAVDLDIRSLVWLEGCWRGDVAGREFLEHWLPWRGGMMIGVSQTVFQGKTPDFEYLRLDAAPDGVYYVAIPSGKVETAFKLTSAMQEDKNTIFTFTNPADVFPQRIVYRRATEGWLYVHVEGTVNGVEKRVIYPMRRVECGSAEPAPK